MEPKGWKETVINYSDAASDIILFDDAAKIYKNIITGNTSEYLYKCIREGRRFIVEDSRCMHKVMSGEYAYYDEGNDSLIVTKVIFDKNTKTWKETARCVFYKENGCICCKEMGFMDYVPSQHDIASQTLAFREGEDLKPVKDWYKEEKFVRCNTGSMLAVYHFLGGDLQDSSYTRMPFNGSNMLFLLWERCSRGPMAYRNNPILTSSNMKDFHKKKKFGNSIFITQEEQPMPDFPAEVYGIMEKYTLNSIKKETIHKIKVRALAEEENLVFCCLQPDGEDVVQRFFRVSVALEYPLENSKIVLIETDRFLIKKNDALQTSYAYEDAGIIHAEDLSGTFMEHVSYMIEDHAAMLKNFAEDDCADMGLFRKKYGFSGIRLMRVAQTLAKNPFIEKLCNSGIGRLREFICLRIASKQLSSDDELDDIFGQITAAGNINASLGIPKGLLEYAAKKDNFYAIKEIKALFFKKEWRQYLYRMNIEDAKQLFDMVDEIKKRPGDDVLPCIEKLFLLYGCKNWKKFFTHAMSPDIASAAQFYAQYLDMLLIIGEPAKNYEWNLSGDRLYKSHKALADAYSITMSPEKQVKDQMIKETARERKFLSFEDDSYCIILPQSSDDIIEEGMKLRHCVKDFTDRVAKGMTTVCFIRKKTAPDAPFFTLEIKQGYIRQCHGFDNRNISTEKGLEEFLRKFCDAKGIRYENPDGLLN